MTRDSYLQDARLFALRGTDLKHARLDEQKVRQIRENRRGKTLRQLAEEFGVHYRTVEKVHYYETWRHVI